MEDVWDSFPLYIGYKDIMKLGFKKYRIYEWFNCESFPEMVRKGGMRVNKFKFREWLEQQEVTFNEE